MCFSAFCCVAAGYRLVRKTTAKGSLVVFEVALLGLAYQTIRPAPS